MPKRGTPKITKVDLLLSEKTEYGRGVLRGIADFAKDHPHWRFKVQDPDRKGLAAMEAWPADGLIVMLNEKSLAPRLLALGKPTVTVCSLPGAAENLCVQSDDRMVGRLGAEHLLELRAATYGFVGLTEGAYVAVRAAAFAETINQNGSRFRSEKSTVAGMFPPPVVRTAKSFAQTISRRWLKFVVLIAMLAGLPELLSVASEALVPTTPAHFDWTPGAANSPVGVARGVHPGRVVWARDPAATKWAGNWKEDSDQWWTEANTDQTRVDAMMSAVLRRLTGAETDEAAWTAIFRSFNQRARGLGERGYQPGEAIAVKINLNNSENVQKTDNKIDAAPQAVLAVVRQLVKQAHVVPADIVVYDARRTIPQTILTKVWAEFKDVRFVQNEGAKAGQPINPAFGDHHGLEAADWVEGIAYSNGKYNEARMIPKQIQQATYLINFALLKLHSYPYDNMEDGDAGQTAVSMTGKNHFGSIKGTWELHPAINTTQEATSHAYSPMVDLASSPNLGAKTILYLLDGLYSGRKWRSYPQHFPNPPFNNRVEPYENSDWPASLLASQDGVALDSVGLDILNSQTANNIDPTTSQPRILIRENADDYLYEMADPEHAPSKTAYVQGGKPVTSLGVHEHWDSDATRRYSRNLDPVNGKGIELIYIPMGEGQKEAAAAAPKAAGSALAVPTETLAKAGAGPSSVEVPPAAPAVFPGKGLAQHDFFYAGEGLQERMFIVRDGKIVWSYTHPGEGEISDAVLSSDGSILFAHQFGITEVNAAKQVVWALRSWTAPADLGPSTTIQILDEPSSPENVRFGDIAGGASPD